MNTQQRLIQVTNLQPHSEQLPKLRTTFQEDGYVALPGLLTTEGLGELRHEMAHLESVATRRDLNMACMNNTPRHMTTVGGHIIAHESHLISELYSDSVLLQYIRDLTGLELVLVHEMVERHVANFLHQPGDTHGAHFDDYPVALILFIETPPSPQDGGLLEFAANASNLTQIDGPNVKHAFHVSGDAYVLRSDTTAHRVTALNRQARRVVLNFAYTTPDSCSITTPSASLLYD